MHQHPYTLLHTNGKAKLIETKPSIRIGLGYIIRWWILRCSWRILCNWQLACSRLQELSREFTPRNGFEVSHILLHVQLTSTCSFLRQAHICIWIGICRSCLELCCNRSLGFLKAFTCPLLTIFTRELPSLLCQAFFIILERQVEVFDTFLSLGLGLRKSLLLCCFEVFCDSFLIFLKPCPLCLLFLLKVFLSGLQVRSLFSLYSIGMWGVRSGGINLRHNLRHCKIVLRHPH